MTGSRDRKQEAETGSRKQRQDAGNRGRKQEAETGSRKQTGSRDRKQEPEAPPGNRLIY